MDELVVKKKEKLREEKGEVRRKKSSSPKILAFIALMLTTICVFFIYIIVDSIRGALEGSIEIIQPLITAIYNNPFLFLMFMFGIFFFWSLFGRGDRYGGIV